MKRLSLFWIGVALLQFGSFAFAQNRASQPLPDGPGKQLVENLCSSCHSVATITRAAGYSEPEQWRALFSTMIELSDAQANTIATYLAQHYPEDTSRRPNLIAGDTEIEIIEWTVPTLGQRARDPIEAPDGSIWWTGMWASLTGRLDPATGVMEEFKLPPSSRPHSVLPDQQGNIWYTGNSNATIGMLNPATGEVVEYKTQAQDPHTATFHPNGNLYFTAQRAGVLGRLNPSTGEVTEVDSEPRPYGIQVAADGTVWVAFNGTNKIGAVDPESLAIKYYTVPGEKTRIRRLAIDSKGIIWFVNSTMGKIGRLDPSSGEIKQWDSPSGASSHPYAIAVIDDVIWYNESGMRPDALVRFSPRTESFQSWAIPSGAGIIRNVWVTEDDNLLIHQIVVFGYPHISNYACA